ncbi:klaroid protein isoform X1 [Eupeodes corollae]|uniref:klaroid protein isoform X1 n=1 Tax=Eupeodes corollae TaxID=290404 RepID=UPI002493BA00|nr:klaroid protein isoform X1 [Eupeodes corollae]XP_055916284.1 klaroid protein isoform X1 [Eupeodes corollae]
MGDIVRETRNRSRSKTPFLRSQCDNESCAHVGEEGHSHHHHHEKKKKTPNVQTITEIVEVTTQTPPSAEKSKKSSTKTVTSTISSSSSSSQSVSKSKDSGKTIKTSDYSSEDASPETHARIARIAVTGTEGAAQSTSSFSSSSITTKTIITSSGGGAGAQRLQGNKNIKNLASSVLTSTPKGLQQQNFSFGNHKEFSQNEINSDFERSPQFGVSNNNSSSKNSFKEHTTNGSLVDHAAYKEYKDAGEYWNKYPKTDYTYSKRSPHRREICPGVIAMPNMSRCSLENHHDRVNEMIQRSPAQEEFIRRRYAYQTTTSNSYNRRAAEKLIYDSQDEVDMAQFESYRKSKRYLSSTARSTLQSESWYSRVLTTVVTTFYSFWSAISGGSSENDLYKTRIAQEERGFFGGISHAVSSVFIGLFRYVYMAISTVLSIDTWLLKSSNAENKNKKRFLLLLLILLPLLLLTGLFYYLNPNEPFPPRSFSEITYTLPKVDLSEFYNEEKYEAIKTSALNRLDDLRDYTHEYFAYLKQVSMNIVDEAWSLLEDDERQYRLERVYNFLPLTLAGLRQTMSSLDLRNLFTRPNLESSHNQYNKIINEDITGNLKKSLSPEEYENILNHVNIYVQKLVDAKLEQQLKDNLEVSKTKQQNAVSNEMLIIIANTVRESIQKLEPILVKKTQSDLLGDKMMKRIVENVQVELKESQRAASSPSEPATLSAEHIKQISNMIRENIQINNHEYNIIDRIDIDGLLLQILQSPNLAQFVDSRILLAKQESSEAERQVIARQDLIITELNKEIEFIKASLSDKLSENQDLHYSISNLKLSQDNLLKRVDSHESLVSNRFGTLLAEIDEKLSLLRDDQFALINKQVKLSLIDILGYKDSGNVENIDLQNWIRNTFVAKEFLEQKLSELSAQSSDNMKKEIDHSGMILMKQISEKLKIEILRSVDLKQKQSAAAISGEIKMALSENEIKKIVKGVLAVYDADKTGLVDYALESAGGQILSTRCTENYPIKSAQISVFGIPLWYPANTPRIAISPNVQPGECWAFQGFPGFLVLRLNTLIHVTGFTLEHIPKTLTPNGKIDSAPRNFTTWGLEHENDHEPVLLGEYEYEDNDLPLQYFPVQQDVNGRLFDIVEMRIESNHGNPQYTCLYRFRVHGKPPTLEV